MTPGTSSTNSQAVNPYRLPRNVVPWHYNLELAPNLAEATFSGTQEVSLEVREATTTIVLNSLDIEIDEAICVDKFGVRHSGAVSYDVETERATIAFESPIAAGSARLNLVFRGELNDKLVGFYRSTYTDASGVTQTLAVSQMESTHARRAFPCWDEPAFKATFDITLVVEEGLTAVSNAREVGREARGPGQVAVKFATTMKMSTYLVAFVVGPLEITEVVVTNGGIPIRLVHPIGKGHLTTYALEAASFALDFFAEWFDIPYPADKLDLVAVPDFAFGAMENVGCVTFREVLLLIDPETATQTELERLVDVVAHELAHMWFGNLVTMDWWEGIWLNEAFATFMELLATDAFRPEWQRWLSFGLSRTAAFDVDGLTATRPIEFPVISPDDAEGMFDLLTYEKGAAVLRMLQLYLGDEAFQAGIRRYLSAHQYGNTKTTDLWDAIEEASGEPVRRVMDTWIYQGGFPVVEVELDNSAHQVTVGQRQYLAASDAARQSSGKEWVVPVTLRSSVAGNVENSRLLLEPETASTLKLSGTADWVVANVDGGGFYRVSYGPVAATGLQTNLFSLSAAERYGLLDDTWAALLANRTSSREVLDLVGALAAGETDLSVWERIGGVLRNLDRYIPETGQTAWQSEVQSLVAPASQRLGTEPQPDESDRDRQLRGVLLGLLGTVASDPSAIGRARELHNRHLAGETGLDPALVAVAIEVVASQGDTKDFAAYMKAMEEAATPQESIRYQYALADFPGETEVAQLLEAVSNGVIRTQNMAFVLRRALLNQHGGNQVWRYITKNWGDLSAKLPSMSVVRMAEGVRALSTPELATEVHEFFRAHPLPQAERTLAQHLEALDVNVGVRQRETEVLAELFS